MKTSRAPKKSSRASRPAPPAHGAEDLLFEIGTEELPAAYLPGLIEQLGQEAAALLEANHLAFGRVEAYGTPRRLVLMIRELSAEQRTPSAEIRGPSKQACYDAKGQPTAALLGFLKSQRGTPAQTKVVASEKGEYLYLVKPASATPTAKALTGLLPQLIGKLRAPKTMRWDATGVRFARPIRWLLALYGSNPVSAGFGSLTTGARTWVGLPKRPQAIPVKSLADYQRALARSGVVLDQAKRRSLIEGQVARLAARSHGRAAPEMLSHGLLDEVTALTERPVELPGAFDPKYLALPREVLLASMAKYQRVFAVETAEGALLPQFIAILDGKPGRPADVRRVMERILNARLADSLLFWSDDHKRLPLERMAGDLSGVTFHEKLGSMAEKTLRLRGLAEPLVESWHLTDEEQRALRRAAQLAKADLVSTMVKEFPTLQGVVGKHYAKDSHESGAVACAIEEHYLPAGTQLPATLIGSALAIIDKYDTLSSYFALGIMPTGDQDPFGLRRAAQGIVEVAWNVHRPLLLAHLIRARGSMEPLRAAGPKEIAAVGQKIQRYLFDRLYTFAWPAPSLAGAADPRALAPTQAPLPDCIDAVLASPCDDLLDAMDRIVMLQRLHGHPGLLKAAKVIERTRNILRGAALRQPDVDPARLQEPLEQRLWELYRAHQPQLVELSRQRAYQEATTRFGEVFYEPLHAFFDRVLVNVPEPALQQNRLALMRAIHTLYTDRIADLSKLTILQREESPS